MSLYAEILQEAEDKRKAQEAHAESVRLARKNSLFALAQEADASLERRRKDYKTKGYKTTRQNRCRDNHDLIEKMIASGKNYKETAFAISNKDGIPISMMTVRNYCIAQKIKKPITCEERLFQQISSIRQDCKKGYTYVWLAKKYNVPLSTMGRFLRKNNISTARKTGVEKLTPYLSDIRKDIKKGLTRPQLAKKYKTSMDVITRLLKANGLSTAKKK